MAYIGAGISRFNTADELTVTGDAQIDGTTLVVDSTNNRVGIGTTSPSTLLHLDASADGRVARFGSGTSDTGGMYVTHNSGSTRSFEVSADNILILDADRSNGRGSSRLQFNVDGSEAMRITSGRTVMVGRTATGYSNTGAQFTASGAQNIFVADGDYALGLGRNNSDGIIQEFRKDGSTVGVVSVYGADMFIGTDDAGLTFNNSADLIAPVNPTTGATRDGAIDLGASNARFKDGYFSGILYNTSLRGQNDTDTGIDVGDTTGSLSNTLTFLTGGGERMRIDSSGNLLVGKTTTAFGTQGIRLEGSNGKIELTRNNNIPFAVNRLTSDGDLIQFFKDSTAVGSIGVVEGDNLFISSTATDHAGLKFNNTAMGAYVNGGNSDGTMDIGTHAVRFKDLYLSGTAYVDTAVEIHAGNPLKLQNVAGNGFATIQNAGAGTNTDLSFNTAGSEAMRIDSSGNLIIGATAVNGPDGGNATGIVAAFNGRFYTSTANGGNVFEFNVTGTGNVGSINVSTSGTSFNTSSDYRLKEAVVDMTGAITRVKSLQPKRFNFIADDSVTVDGFMAHEAQTVVPEAVTGTHNEVDSDGNPVYQGIDQSKLVPLLTGALREAITKIETLETENSTQATQIADLITRVTALEAS